MALSEVPLSGQNLAQTRDPIHDNFVLLNTFFTASLTESNGYQKFPNGLLLKWGIALTLSGANTITTAAPAYSTMLAAYVVINGGTDGAGDLKMVRVFAIGYGGNQDAFRVVVETSNTAGSATANVRWLTIGIAA